MIRALPLFASLLLTGMPSASAGTFDPAPIIQVTPQIVRGPQPSAEVLRNLRDQRGIRTVISLRATGSSIRSEKAIVEGLGMKFVSVPFSPYGVPTQKILHTIMDELTNPENQPVYLHCKIGKDRTGLVIGLYRVWIEKWRPREAWREMKRIGFHSFYLGLTYAFWEGADWSARHEDDLNEDDFKEDVAP